MRPNQSARIHLKPIVWGIVLFSLWISVPSYMVPSYMAFPLVDYGLIDTDVSSDVMPADAMSLDNVLQVLSGQFWSHFQFDVSHILYLLVCALPLIVYALMNKHSESKHTEAVLILLALSLFALGFCWNTRYFIFNSVIIARLLDRQSCVLRPFGICLCCLFRWVLLPIEHPIAL